jgi:phosphonate transport system substrate-binding protein
MLAAGGRENRFGNSPSIENEGSMAMNWHRGTTALLVLVIVVAFSVGGACQSTINVGMIPDSGAKPSAVLEKAPLKNYLARNMGRTVNLVIPANYQETVEGLGNGSLDFAYLGGFTYIKAHKEFGVIPLVQRSADLQFHSLFITNAKSDIQSLSELKGKKFAFGDVNSSSGHLIPYLELRQAGIEPDRDLDYRYTGNHPATAKAVESGTADAGALDETVYNSMIAEGKLDPAKVKVFHTSKPFVDYVWVARKDIDAATQEKFVQAFIKLKEGRDDQVLQVLRGKDFVKANNEEYTVLRLIAQQLKMM